MRGEGRYILPGPNGPVDLGPTAFISQFGRLVAGIAVTVGNVPDLWAQMAVGEIGYATALPTVADLDIARTGLAEVATPGVRITTFDADGTEQDHHTWFSLIGRVLLPDSSSLDDRDDLDDIELVLTRGVVRLETSEKSAVITGFRKTGADTGTITGPGGSSIVNGAAAVMLAAWGPAWNIEQIPCLDVFEPVLGKILSMVTGSY